ncbi:MAG: HlyD family efflux transporter periplasmic adaptor subunit, partial [Dehalococcoidia bacterium]|nr:HlyD family efflux transporter periplasmic adaptor subunit [Dehalococcoidia bacterium]
SPQPTNQPNTPSEKPALPSSVESKLSPKPQPAETARSSPAIKVNGSGNTVVSTDAKLTFGTGGKIEKLNVKKGDRVTKDTVLAKLDMNSLELAVLQAKTSLAQALLSQSQAEVTLKQAETSVESAILTLDKIKAVAELKDEITDIEWGIKVAQEKMKEPSTPNESNNYWRQQITIGRTNMTSKKKELSELLGKPEYSGLLTYDILLQKYDRLVIEDARIKQRQLEAAELSVVQAKNSIESIKDNIESVKKSLEIAEKQLKDATIIAPFDGIVATLDVKEGDIVPAPAQASRPVIYLIDPTTMELNISVNELDMPKVKVGQEAIVRFDAFSNVTLKGKVTAISPLPETTSRLVNYEVKVAFTVPQTTEIRVGMSATAEITVQ